MTGRHRHQSAWLRRWGSSEDPCVTHSHAEQLCMSLLTSTHAQSRQSDVDILAGLYERAVKQSTRL